MFESASYDTADHDDSSSSHAADLWAAPELDDVDVDDSSDTVGAADHTVFAGQY